MERDVKYIQLPPLPEDIEMPALEAIWLIARMNPEQRRDALKQIEAMAGTEKGGKADYEVVEEILTKYETLDDEDVFSQYVECFRGILAQLVLESYDVAAYVYQKRCVEGLSKEEILDSTRLSVSALDMFLKYFDIASADFCQAIQFIKSAFLSSPCFTNRPSQATVKLATDTPDVVARSSGSFVNLPTKIALFMFSPILFPVSTSQPTGNNFL